MITKKTFKTRAAWEAWHSAEFRVGGSNIGAILGINPYCSPWRLWHEWKNGTATSDSANTARGRFYENAIAQWFEEESGYRIIKRSAAIEVYTNDALPAYFQAAPDRECFAHGEASRAGVEIKDTRKIIDFDDEATIPNEWFAQIQYYMGVLNRSCWYLVVNDGTKSLKFRRFAFNADYFAKMISDASEWVEKYIFGDEEPPMSTADDVNMAYPQSAAGEKKVGSSVFELCEKVRALNAKKREIEKEIDALKNTICAEFDDNDTLVFEGSAVATYKTQAREIIDKNALFADLGDEAKKYIKTTSTRVLKIK